ncbi:hypothetical protein C5167_021219 [Papaver somniferum]|uniref:Uncharacterized protein n=1 Tax=Papaver somniferum TaxID=3469 RepID=A0A4Y7IZE5_PAPSO|nr:hypothetical protein C5167_021219 [Papaver somniferum]
MKTRQENLLSQTVDRNTTNASKPSHKRAINDLEQRRAQKRRRMKIDHMRQRKIQLDRLRQTQKVSEIQVLVPEHGNECQIHVQVCRYAELYGDRVTVVLEKTNVGYFKGFPLLKVADPFTKGLPKAVVSIKCNEMGLRSMNEV